MRHVVRYARSKGAVLALVLAAALWPGYATAAKSNPASVTLVVIGDSLSAGLGVPKDQAFPVKLEARLRSDGHAVRVINAGVSGDTTAGGRARLDWALADGPDGVILELGANDALRGLSTEQAFDNLAAILGALEDAGIPALLAGMRAPPNMGDDYARRFEKIYTDLDARFDVVFYPFFLKGVAARPDLNQDDGMHPTSAGVDVIVDNILPHVETLLERVQTQRDGS